MQYLILCGLMIVVAAEKIMVATTSTKIGFCCRMFMCPIGHSHSEILVCYVKYV
jgi:hypothetical protein